MEITTNPFNEFDNWEVYEDVLRALVNRGDKLDLDGRSLRAQCAHAQHVPHDDVDQTSVGVPTCPKVVSQQANESSLSKTMCPIMRQGCQWKKDYAIIFESNDGFDEVVVACPNCDSTFPMSLVEPSICIKKSFESVHSGSTINLVHQFNCSFTHANSNSNVREPVIDVNVLGLDELASRNSMDMVLDATKPLVEGF